MHRIMVSLIDGSVSVSNVPEGVVVEVRDYDVAQDMDEEEIEDNYPFVDEDDDRYSKVEYMHNGFKVNME
jgi:hypothetical protein